ncbi:MAG: hypothetical protein JO235_13420 [Chroococcidiopsidaceae cyanobacterium CP_BM_RX_35]|nr:hypothetical protein [Chroococcidiopsidaceae cyanobacterium CP_BM_RX_35]
MKIWQVVLGFLTVTVIVTQLTSVFADGYGFLDPVQQAASSAFTAAGAQNGADMSNAIFGFAIAFIALVAIVGIAVGLFLNRVQGVPLLEAFGYAIGIAMFVAMSAMMLKGIGLGQ